jgi:hypothetical protein
LPHKTHTNEKIFDSTILFGVIDAIRLSNPSALYFGLGFREWRRDILPTASVQGLFEKYSWYYGVIGGRVELLRNKKMSLWLDGRFTRPIDPVMNICLSNFDCMDLRLGVNTSGRIALPINFRAFRNSNLIIEPYFESWDFGRSASEELTINGAPAGGSIYEPRSESRNVGVTLSISREF